MIPLRDVIPSRTTPFVTILIIALNGLAFFFEQSMSDRELQRFVIRYGVVPARLAWPSIFTSMFLHGGWLHFLGNMLYLWIFGDNVEDRMGHRRFLVFYLLCGTVATASQVAMNPDSTIPLIGASGAIAGVMGAYIVLYPHSRVLTLVPILFFIELVEIPAIFFLGLWFLLQLFSSAGSIGAHTADAGGVAFFAHVAGFITGMAAILVFRKPQRRVAWWD